MPRNFQSERIRSVLMVVHSTFPAMGGAEIQAARLSSALLRRGWKIQVVALEGPRPSVSDPDCDQIPVTRLRRPRLRGIAGAVLALRLGYELVRRRHEYDIVHVHIVKTLAFVATVVGRLLGKTVVLKVSGYDELDNGLLGEKSSRSIPFRLMNWGCRKANVVVAISRFVQRRLKAAGYKDEQIVYIPNGVDVRRFSPGIKHRRDHGNYNPESQVAVFVGRFSSQKGLFDLLEAWVSVHAEFPTATLYLVGDGELRSGLEVLTRSEVALKNTVVFTGASGRVDTYLAVADCYVCSSHSEGLSNTMLEAMATGLPIVTTAVSGAEDLVKDGVNGFVVPICDPERLAQGIKQVFRDNDTALKMGMESRSVAIQVFNMEQVVRQYENIYCSI